MDQNNQRFWPWHIAGALLGLVVVFAFVTGHPVGTATTYSRLDAIILKFFVPDYVAGNSYYMNQAAPVVEWQMMFVLGMVVSGLIARYFVTKRKGEAVPEMWAANMGDSKGKRYLYAFLGGFLLLLGARIAGGCTSGLFISGGSQLALAALVFAGGMFASGIITAKLLYRRDA